MLSESLLVVVAATLSGGLKGQPTVFAGGNHSSCNASASIRWKECTVLDMEISPQHLLAPWVITLGAIVFLSMPTVLLRSKSKEKGLRTFACNLLQCLGLLSCSFFFSDHPSICFTVGLHSCVRLLVQLELSDGLVGGDFWWGLRYLVACGLLVLEISLGPPVSVVHWPSTPAGTALSCAYLAHLIGCIVPDLILLHVRWLVAAAGYVQMPDY
jgi:hypothetical protein